MIEYSTVTITTAAYGSITTNLQAIAYTEQLGVITLYFLTLGLNVQ